MKKKIIYSCSLCFFAITILFCYQVDAEPTSVSDCMEGEADCADPSSSTNESEENNTELLANDEKTGSLAFELIKMFFALLLVLALIYFLLKFLNKRNKIFNQVKALENLGGISVGQHKSIQIIRIGNKLYLVGVGENVEMLQEITDEEVKQDIFRNKEGTSDDLMGGSLFTSFIPGKKENKADSKTEFKNLFKKELDNMKENRKKMINKHKEDTNE